MSRTIIKTEDEQGRLGVLIDHGDRMLIVRPGNNFPRAWVNVSLWTAFGQRIDTALNGEELAAVMGVISPYAAKSGPISWEHSTDGDIWTACDKSATGECPFPHHRRANG